MVTTQLEPLGRNQSNHTEPRAEHNRSTNMAQQVAAAIP